MEEKKKKNRITSLELFLVFLKVGAFTIGGGYAMLPLIQEELIHRRKWLGTGEFLDTLGITQSLPGPMAINFALLAGYRLRGLKGWFFSLLGAVLPSFLIILTFAIYLWQYRDSRIVQAAFQGIRPIIVVLIIYAAVGMGREMINRRYSLIFFLLFLGALLLFHVHPVVIITIGALTGFLGTASDEKAKGETEE